jgi:hypothetical protein
VWCSSVERRVFDRREKRRAQKNYIVRESESWDRCKQLLCLSGCLTQCKCMNEQNILHNSPMKLRIISATYRRM